MIIEVPHTEACYLRHGGCHVGGIGHALRERRGLYVPAFGSKQPWEDFSFTIRGREFIALVPNCQALGIGKTPLLAAARAVGLCVGLRLIQASEFDDYQSRIKWGNLRPAYKHNSPTSRIYVLRDVIKEMDQRLQCCVCGRLKRRYIRDVDLARELRFSVFQTLVRHRKLKRLHVCLWGNCVRQIRTAQRGPLGQLFRLLRQREAEKRRRTGCNLQLKALRRFLTTGDREVLTSLPRGFGPRETSRDSCLP